MTRKKLLHKAKDFEESMHQETSILTQNFYKVGFADEYYLQET